MKMLFGLALMTFALWLDGYHIVWKPTPTQQFGCEHTYVNTKGEDTGECN